MTDRELFEKVLEALEEMGGGYSQNLIAALRERLAQPEQEPHSLLCVCGAEWDIYPDGKEVLAATAPQRRDWVGLTDEENT